MTNVLANRKVTFLLLLILSLLAPASAITGEQVGAMLTTDVATGVLLTAGIVFWFLSVLTMGTGVAEVLCFSSFLVLFGGRYLTGQELWVPLALLLAGAVFAAVEVFVIPGLGVFGVLSVLSFAGLSVLLMESPQAGLGIFSLSVLLSMIGGYLVMKFLPKFFVTRKMFVLEPPKSTPKKSPVVETPLVKPGDVGETVSTLRPIGTGQFGTNRIEVVSEGEFLKGGVPIEVVRVEGQKVVVRSCRTSS